MTSAENIITSYLEQGYSVEALRLVAMARPQPLRDELLAILEGMEVVAEPVACYAQDPVGDLSPTRDGDVLFSVPDDAEATCDEAGNYDLMAATVPGQEGDEFLAEESVAEVYVNSPANDLTSDIPRARDVEAAGELGVWSRAWSGCGDEGRSAAPVRDVEEDWIASGEAVQAAPGVDGSLVPAPAHAESDGGSVAPASGEPGTAPSAALAVLSEQTRLLEAQALVGGGADSAGEEGPSLPAEGRKERRRRQRAEKKRGKRSKKAANALPEIVMTPEAAHEPQRAEEVRTIAPLEKREDTATITAIPEESGEALSLMALTERDGGADAEPRPDGEREHGLLFIPEETPVDFAPGRLRGLVDGDFDSSDDHLMIIASGGLDLRRSDGTGCIPFRLNGGEEESGRMEDVDDNIIIFGDKFPMFSGYVAYGEEEADGEEGDYFPPVLRMLPPVEEATPAPSPQDTSVPESIQPTAASVPTATENTAHTGDAAFDSADRALLLRALVGVEPADGPAESEIFRHDHVIISMEPEAPEEDAAAREALLRMEIEAEYQTRLDEFALRLLDAQAGIARGEESLREKQTEIAARDTLLADLQNRLTAEEKKQAELRDRLDQARRETGARQAELDRLSGMLDEHERLYGEFEDLRRAYNEVVSDVMPGLQGERDELALTVERQVVQEKKLRSSLASSKRRLAVGYVLSAAACVMLVAMPVAHWMRAGRDSRELAMEHQKVSELHEQLEREISHNVEARSTIADLEQVIQRYSTELADAQNRSRELNRMSQQHSQGIAVFKPEEYGRDGTPTRTSTMALQGTGQPGGRLRTNEVRDPAGSIESTFAYNTRNRVDDNAPQMAGRNRRGEIPVSSVAQSNRQGTANTLRPGANSAPAGGTRPSASATGPQTAAPQTASTRPASGDRVKATVKKGEGVAQVVYRVLGTWDPEVVAWVIRENKIQTNARGNPIIQPGQELRLPKDGRIGQTASAGRTR